MAYKLAIGSLLWLQLGGDDGALALAAGQAPETAAKILGYAFYALLVMALLASSSAGGLVQCSTQYPWRFQLHG